MSATCYTNQVHLEAKLLGRERRQLSMQAWLLGSCYSRILVQLSTCRDVVINHEKVKFFLIAVLLIVYCRKQHTTGLDTHHCSRWKVCDCNQSLSNQFFRLIISVNTGKDSSVCACSIIQCELKKLLRLRNCLTSLNLNCSEITLAESIEIYCILKERLYSYIAEIDLVVRSEEAVIVVCLLILMYLSVILTIALECREPFEGITTPIFISVYSC